MHDGTGAGTGAAAAQASSPKVNAMATAALLMRDGRALMLPPPLST